VRSGLYNEGFTNSLSAQGSAWIVNPSLGLTGTLTISNSTLNLSYQVSITDKKVTKTSGSANSLQGTVNPATGAITLVFGNGDAKATDTGYAALLQDADTGGGYFATKTDAGIISLTLTAPAAQSYSGAGEEISSGDSDEEAAAPPSIVVSISLTPSGP
jgi:hypothetical protein